MPWQAWFTLATILVMIVALVREWARVDVTILLALGTLLLAGVVSPIEAFSGVAWEAVITIASLYVVAAGIHQAGILAWIDRWLAKPGRTVTSLLFRMTAPAAVLSALLNNTPVVAMLIPRMEEVAEKTGISASKLLMPLSFAAIGGGMITLIGTSTNIIASGLVRDAGLREFGLFEFAWIGIPVAVLTVSYLSLVGHRLMPNATPGDQVFDRAQRRFRAHWEQSRGKLHLDLPQVREQTRTDRKAWAIPAMLALLIALHIAGALPLAAAAFAGALGTLLTGFLRGAQLRQAVDIGVILTIAGAFGIGHAVQESGLAAELGHAIATILPGRHPLTALLFLYLGTMIVTEIITNSAAVVIMIPIALAAAADTGMDPRAAALAVTIASSASFLSPLGYQTNLMVMGAGGYRFRDYFRAGLPVSVGVMAITLTAVFLKWL